MYSCEELQLLVNNVLDAMQISTDTTALTLEELVVADVVHDVLRHIDPRWLQEHHLVLNISPDIVVLAHAQYLRQILRNLLSNSFKYAPVGTPVEITAERYGDTALVARPSSEVCISVKDYGPGIPPAEIPRLFVQFGRLKRDLSGKIRGTGLGLYVSKQLVEAMNGRIWAESSGIEGEGSRFCFTLPCAPRSKIQADEAASPLSDQPSLI
jgi:signal transduction histidine kinase